MGGVAEAVRRAGGSVARVFRRADLPLRLLEHPDQVILLRDQLALVEYAVAEIGDEALAPRLSLQAGFRSLGPLAHCITAAPSLAAAIERCNRGIGPLLQSATHMDLQVHAGVAAWRYRISDPATLGRRHNELLALGYMTDILRHFAGRGALPLRARLAGGVARSLPTQELLGCEVLAGDCAALEFDAHCLALRKPAEQPDAAGPGDAVPGAGDLRAGVAQLMRLALLEQRPTIVWMARRLGLTPRTLQRKLHEEGSSFEALREHELMRHAARLLEGSALSISEIAFELGYSGSAQFTRAAVRWAGAPPRAWRQQLRLASAGARCKESDPVCD